MSLEQTRDLFSKVLLIWKPTNNRDSLSFPCNFRKIEKTFLDTKTVWVKKIQLIKMNSLNEFHLIGNQTVESAC